MTEPRTPSDLSTASHSVESEMEGIGDPEAAPVLPAGTVTAHSAVGGGRVRPAAGSRPAFPITREILQIGWPVMLSQALVSVAGLVDRAMIGRLGGETGSAVPLAAVGYATQLFFLIQSTLFAVGLACVALMARAIGSGDPQRARQTLASSLQVSFGVTLLFTLLILANPSSLLALLGARPEVVAEGMTYLQLLVSSSLLLAVTLVLDSALRANKNTRTPMLISFAITLVKLVANWVFIFGKFGVPSLGLAGAGWATLLSQIVGLLLFILVVARQSADSPVSVSWRALLHPDPLARDVLRIAAPGIAERVVLNLGLLSYFWVLSRYYGTLAVAAYTLGVPLLSFSWIPGNGYAQSCATLVGQSLGAGKRGLARAIGRRSALLALATAIPLGALFGFFRFPLASLFTHDAAVIEALGPFMLALAIAQPFLQLHFTLGGTHRGAGDTWTPLVAASIGNWFFRVPLACLFAIVLHADVIWVWYALVADHMARATLLIWTFRRGRWIDYMERMQRRKQPS